MKILKESRDELAQGVFWITDLDNINNNQNYCFPIYSMPDGTVISADYELNAKSGITFNHEKLWKELPNKLTNNKKYNYYPRGRVQINNNKAIVYLNPNIDIEEIRDFIIKEFKLYKINGINNVRFIADGSEHYKCHLDN